MADMDAANQYDLIIVGGGLAGLAMAVAVSGGFSTLPLKTLLIDRDDPEKLDPEKRDFRGSAITESSRRMLDATGVWCRLADHAEPMREIIVTDSRLGDDKRPVLLGFDESLLRDRPSAHMIENHRLVEALKNEAMKAEAVTMLPNSSVERVFSEGSGAVVVTEAGQTFKSSLIVAADGRHSKLRSMAGIDTVNWDYDQSALVLNVEVQHPHFGRAEEHFLPAGPFAILPLKGNRVSLVWTEERQLAQELKSMPKAEFQKHLEQRFGSHLGAIKIDTNVQTYPLSFQFARNFCAERIALIGDAAHVIHPIAGLGFNLGLRDIAALAECLHEAILVGRDIGHGDVLESYELWRRADTVSVSMATDGLNRLFSNDNSAIRVLRDMGLQAVNQLPALKRAFMATAAGTNGRLPKLMAGERL